MKKTLHGKRYLRSRASVMIGRERRAQRKLERGIDALSFFVKHQLPTLIANFSDAMCSLGDVMSRAALSMAEVIKVFIESHPEIITLENSQGE